MGLIRTKFFNRAKINFRGILATLVTRISAHRKCEKFYEIIFLFISFFMVNYVFILYQFDGVGHLQQINLQRASLYGPPILGHLQLPVAAGHLQRPLAAI